MQLRSRTFDNFARALQLEVWVGGTMARGSGAGGGTWLWSWGPAGLDEFAWVEGGSGAGGTRLWRAAHVWMERGFGWVEGGSGAREFATGKTVYHPLQTARKIILGTHYLTHYMSPKVNRAPSE